jgi:hypothetical protein
MPANPTFLEPSTSQRQQEAHALRPIWVAIAFLSEGGAGVIIYVDCAFYLSLRENLGGISTAT